MIDSTVTRKKDHYALVGEPEMLYLDHITLERGTGAEIADGLYKYVKNEMSFGDKLRVIEAVSTAVNTGKQKRCHSFVKMSFDTSIALVYMHFTCECTPIASSAQKTH